MKATIIYPEHVTNTVTLTMTEEEARALRVFVGHGCTDATSKYLRGGREGRATVAEMTEVLSKIFDSLYALHLV